MPLTALGRCLSVLLSSLTTNAQTDPYCGGLAAGRGDQGRLLSQAPHTALDTALYLFGIRAHFDELSNQTGLIASLSTTCFGLLTRPWLFIPSKLSLDWFCSQENEEPQRSPHSASSEKGFGRLWAEDWLGASDAPHRLIHTWSEQGDDECSDSPATLPC